MTGGPARRAARAAAPTPITRLMPATATATATGTAPAAGDTVEG
ncbi:MULTISPECIES: hypothetical protein [unclassified Streptomyces]|nr:MULTISPECIES: hypothetical protein [unclassified Streptomyces]